jgi:Cytochrome c554 and c-prime
MRYAALAIIVAACSSAPKDPVAELQDPSTCMQCHPQHYDQWSGSMHAYASQDPVFVAMNNRGQREAQLGTFCAQCHVPMAVANGRTDFTNFDPSTLTPAENGVTCYFCHNVKDVIADHNNGLQLGMDQTMRGGAQNPAETPAHDSDFDAKLMASQTNQSTMCGSCHDVVTPAGVALERTYTEWQGSLFSQDDPAKLLPVTCSGCHMISSTGVIAQGTGLNVGTRTDGFHDHSLAAIDQAVTSFPNTAEQGSDIQTELEGAIAIVGPTPIGGGAAPGGICVVPENGGQITVRTDSFQIGHMYPSGAAQDRRAWLEVIAYDGSDNVLFSSGVVADDQDPEDINDAMVNCTGSGPTDCSGFWDRALEADGTTPAHFFWQVASEVSHQLKPQVTSDPNSPLFDHSTTAAYSIGALTATVDHITTRLRTRPFNYAMLNDLVAGSDLDPMYAQSIVTVEDPGTMKMWTRATSDPVTGCNPN